MLNKRSHNLKLFNSIATNAKIFNSDNETMLNKNIGN